MYKIDIAQLVGPLAITHEGGEQLLAQISERLGAGDSVQLDFQSVDVFASPFFNAALAPLVRDFSTDELNKRIKMVGLSADGADVVGRVIENAREYLERAGVQPIVDALGDQLLNQNAH